MSQTPTTTIASVPSRQPSLQLLDVFTPTDKTEAELPLQHPCDEPTLNSSPRSNFSTRANEESPSQLLMFPCSPTSHSTNSSTLPTAATAKSFRLNAQTIFATAPQCSMSKDQAMTNLLSGPHPVEWAKICQEKHQDNSLHLHFLFKLKKKINIRNPREFDYLTNTHLNIQGAKDARAVSIYISKEDPNPSVYGHPPAATPYEKTTSSSRKKSKSSTELSKTDTIANLLATGHSLASVAALHPGFTMMNLHKMQAFQLKQAVISNPLKLDHPPRLTLTIPTGTTLTDAHQAIFEWFLANLFNYKRAIKTKQLYIWGPPNMNKTTLVQELAKTLPMYLVPMFELNDDLWNDFTYEFAVMDEFTAKWCVRAPTFLNSFADGQMMPLKVKYSVYIKKHNIPLVILSNFPPEMTIHESQLPQFHHRFEVVHVTSPIPFEMLKVIPNDENREETHSQE